MSANETEKTQTPRCGHETKSGPCVRPLGHAHGHMSQSVLDVKTANAKAKREGSLSPEEMEAKETERAAKAAERIEAAKAAHAAKLAKLEEMAAEYGMKLVPMTKKEQAERAAAQAGATTESAEGAA